jgi:hypothetical protein
MCPTMNSGLEDYTAKISSSTTHLAHNYRAVASVALCNRVTHWCELSILTLLLFDSCEAQKDHKATFIRLMTGGPKYRFVTCSCSGGQRRDDSIHANHGGSYGKKSIFLRPNGGLHVVQVLLQGRQPNASATPFQLHHEARYTPPRL